MNHLLTIAIMFILLGVYTGAQAQIAKDPLVDRPLPQQQGGEAQSMNKLMHLGFTPDDKHILVAGDMIQFLIREDEDLPMPLVVREDGSVHFPYVGSVQVHGSTPKQLADFLKLELEKKHYYRATVYIGVERSNRVRGYVRVTGQVRHERIVEIDRKDFRLSDAIFAADGFAPMAKDKEVLLIRTHEDGTVETIKIDTRPIFKKGDIKSDILLKDGDRIVVPKSIFQI